LASLAVPYEFEGRSAAKMKYLALLLLVASAFAAPDSVPEADPKAEADAESWYYGYYGHPYRGYYGYGGWGGYYGGYYGYPYRYWWKRDAEQQQMPYGAMPQGDNGDLKRVARSPDEEAAEGPAAEPAAAPALLYSGYYPYYHYPYYTHYTHPVTYTTPVTYAHPYTYYANSGGAVHIVKRDAESRPEADPKAEADPESWYYGYYGYPYRRYYGYGYYGHPYRYGYYWGK
jgi:hypothetical protein